MLNDLTLDFDLGFLPDGSRRIVNSSGDTLLMVSIQMDDSFVLRCFIALTIPSATDCKTNIL